MNLPSDPFVFQRTRKIAKNRVVLAAMTNKQSHEDGTLSNAEIDWLVHRAKGWIWYHYNCRNSCIQGWSVLGWRVWCF